MTTKNSFSSQKVPPTVVIQSTSLSGTNIQPNLEQPALHLTKQLDFNNNNLLPTYSACQGATESSNRLEEHDGGSYSVTVTGGPNVSKLGYNSSFYEANDDNAA